MNNEKVKFLLNWNHFSDHLSSCMTKLMTDSTFSDIIITTADKHMIYSHRFVLAYSSKYFQRLLKHLSKKKSDHLVVALPEIKYDIFKILMNYMYKGETQVPHELLPSVLKAGRFLEISGLINLNDHDTNGSSDGSSVCNSSEEYHEKIIQLYNNSATNTGRETPKRQINPKMFSKENANVSPLEAMATGRKQSKEDRHSGETLPKADNDNENGSVKKPLGKYKIQLEEAKEFVPGSLKRKPQSKNYLKRTPSTDSITSQSSESPVPKKLLKECLIPTELLDIKIKEEIVNSPSPNPENVFNEEEIIPGNVTIKTEAPEEMELYTKLKCDICKEDYTNPSQWVKHMTEKHREEGYLAYQMMKNVPSNGIIKCITCSCVCFSTAEWIMHIQKWHTDSEVAPTNKGERRSSNRMKKKIETDQEVNCNRKENDSGNTIQ